MEKEISDSNKHSRSNAAAAYDSAVITARQRPRLAASAARVSRLFEKQLTPSDVGKLNRLVIPKRFAVKYFPEICGVERENVELVCFDRRWLGWWSFKYCYWRSSRSFALTAGWSRFARERELRSGDRVIFSSYECSDGRKLCVVDVAYDRRAPIVIEGDDNEALHMKVRPSEDDLILSSPSCIAHEGFRLFGVQII